MAADGQTVIFHIFKTGIPGTGVPVCPLVAVLLQPLDGLGLKGAKVTAAGEAEQLGMEAGGLKDLFVLLFYLVDKNIQLPVQTSVKVMGKSMVCNGMTAHNLPTEVCSLAICSICADGKEGGVGLMLCKPLHNGLGQIIGAVIKGQIADLNIGFTRYDLFFQLPHFQTVLNTSLQNRIVKII